MHCYVFIGDESLLTSLTHYNTLNSNRLTVDGNSFCSESWYMCMVYLSVRQPSKLLNTKYHMTTNFGEANIWRLDEKLQLAEF